MSILAVVFKEIFAVKEPQEIILIEKREEKKNSGFKGRIGFYLANCELIKWQAFYIYI